MPMPESKLFLVTSIVAITTMAITFWMAFYLFARGFQNTITLRTVVVLLAISAFFFGVYNNIFHQTIGSASWRAVLLITGMAFWYSVTYNLMSENSQRRYRQLAVGMYGFAAITGILILTPGSFINEEGNAFYSSRVGGNASNILYEIYQFTFLIGSLFNLLIEHRSGLTAEGRYFLIATILPAGKILSGMLVWITPNPLPRFIPDLFIFCGVFIFSLSVLRHQSLMEKRTTFQDFPISALTALGLAAIYALLALQWGIPIEALAWVVAFAILTHSLYDLVREFLDRQRIRREGAFRRQLRQLENLSANEETLPIRAQRGLDLLCRTLDSSGGFIAIRRGENFVVIATRGSVAVNSQLPATSVACEDISHPKTDQFPDIAWIAPVFEGQIQVAVIALSRPKAKLDFSAGDLELLAEVADQVGTLISLVNLTAGRVNQIQQLVDDSQMQANELNSVTEEMIAAMAANPDSEFIKIVEEGLRHVSDYIALGQLPLAGKLNITGETRIDCGKQLHQILIEAIESLRPAGMRPPEPLPRIWYSYAILHDAYIQGVPNREIMARLYISEGTFNRTRRNALRGLARLLTEKQKRTLDATKS
jgi:hypothetical protein